MKNRTKLKTALKQLDTLPAMPLIAKKLLALPLDTEDGENEMLKLIERDPQLSAKIIGLANTPLLGSQRKMTSVRDAAILLGITRVKSVTIGIAAMSALTKMPQGRLSVQNLWLHSLAVALSMRTISQAMPARSRPKDDQIFLAGLLHDIGYLVLAFLDTRRSDELHIRMADEPDSPMLEIEQELLGISHCELGAQLAQNWDLPSEIIPVLRYHHTPESVTAPKEKTLILIINIAERLLPSLGISELSNPCISETEWCSLGIDPARDKELRAQVMMQAEQAMHLAGIMA